MTEVSRPTLVIGSKPPISPSRENLAQHYNWLADFNFKEIISISNFANEHWGGGGSSYGIGIERLTSPTRLHLCKVGHLNFSTNLKKLEFST